MKLIDKKLLFDLIVAEAERAGQPMTPGRRWALRQAIARDSIHVLYRAMRAATRLVVTRKV